MAQTGKMFLVALRFCARFSVTRARPIDKSKGSRRRGDYRGYWAPALLDQKEKKER
jgi:hypothetical protein